MAIGLLSDHFFGFSPMGRGVTKGMAQIVGFEQYEGRQCPVVEFKPYNPKTFEDLETVRYASKWSVPTLGPDSVGTHVKIAYKEMKGGMRVYIHGQKRVPLHLALYIGSMAIGLTLALIGYIVISGFSAETIGRMVSIIAPCFFFAWLFSRNKWKKDR
jgi:hypothetical protein